MYLRRTCSSSRTSETAIRPALQPMPLRLYVSTLRRSLKWFTSMADSEGVGLKMLQHTTRMSTCTPP